MSKISIKTKKLVICIAIALMLCVAQIIGNNMLIYACLDMYMLFLAWNCSTDFTLPILLFFLPLSPIMRTNPNSFTFYTFGMVMICAISIIKKRFSLKKYQMKVGLILLFLTLLSRLMDGNGLSFDYILFMMMLFLFPVVKEERHKEKYDFFQVVLFFSVGVITAALCAQSFAELPNIKQYIRVDSYLTIVRRCGFYGDPNFYVAQILAAFAGTISLILKEKRRKNLVTLAVLALLLVYCGALSGSKSFLLVLACLLILWIIAIMKMRGRTGLKIAILVIFAIAAVYIVTSALFSSLIDVILTRFLMTKDLESFTTGRYGVWMSYFKEITENLKVFFLGKGFNNVKLNGRASHNTVLQMIYQFGLVGTPVILYWITCFFRDTGDGKKKKLDLKLWIILLGSFMPWLAIDAFFFDEFFLLQWYMLIALDYFNTDTEANNIEISSYGGNLWTKE